MSTRNHFDKSTRNLTSTEAYTPLDDGLLDSLCLDQEVAIYVHGVWVYDQEPSSPPIENFNEALKRLKMSLESEGYHHPLVGFSWDSDTEVDPEGKGWNIAKLIAKENGLKLGQFIVDLKDRCAELEYPNLKIHLIGHSMGARVVLSALDSITRDDLWRASNSNFNISTVNLLGGAIDNYAVLKNNSDIEIEDSTGIKNFYGNEIENRVDRFYNMYNPNDDTLESKIYPELNEVTLYPAYEDTFAAGQHLLSETHPHMPSNYANVNVKDDIITEADANNDGYCDLPHPYVFTILNDFNRKYLLLPSIYNPYCIIKFDGDNHFGYIGFRNFDESFRDEGAIDRVVDTWNTP